MQPGKSICPFVAALEVGLLQVVQLARNDVTIGDYHLHGIARCTVYVKQHMVVGVIYRRVSYAGDPRRGTAPEGN